MAPIRPGPAVKASNNRSLATSRVNKKSYSQSSQPRMPAGPAIIEQFRLHRQREGKSSDMNEEDEDEEDMRRRNSYTKEQKLGAISYATTTWKIQKDSTPKLISKHAAAKDLGITSAMLRHWLKHSSEIENTTKGTRKIKLTNTGCQEPEMENRLVEIFEQARNAGRKITNRWFIRHAKALYAELHPDRVVKRDEKKTEYTCFKFSRGWFEGFKKRGRICVRMPTKVSQAVRSSFCCVSSVNETLILYQTPENFRDRIVS